ncbi:hypothetical protein HRR83_005516 [Exophiala dermatitidis]|uniref:Uncharacterized protein n=2 Tax=Exophiala dermatitidis TaxID=5970 RepID=H6C450_EXODN|nr:uncharacterized protein HMPREF1120_05605 [Exophiala dermatitidis NIH/UT8656]KAJ4516211.1 hypothetical protein HRR74_005368 [Exophiala dermatitidis]EHY57575.1 hypothetical protein HMPREF1120_05605 [Exophiala dermatitidis NIH/UT8656]KAJ4518383.1 hypothetical protein HRR73_003964 [Exophiala dermatitidis]KAJ4533874.1 hypothetical protein HRR76_005827 [Exophiala dermatitidis]KAJ4550030.1 hypothetical protein HRR77_003513 [Exophiala dermatitidis]
MWERLCALFRRHRRPHTSKQRRQSDPLGNLSEVSAPPPIENRHDSGLYRHHTLEENLRRNSRGEDVDGDDEENEDILVRHHTLEENLELARELTQEMRRQSHELRRLSTDREHATSSKEAT